MKPTLDDLRKLAEAAKKWRPDRCFCSFCPSTPDSCGGCESCGKCGACLGAKAAAEDIGATIDVALGRCCHPPEKGTHWVDEMPPTHFTGIAERIASYFGGSDAVTAFANGVRAFCGDQHAR